MQSRDEDDIGGGKGAPWAVRLDSMGPLVAAIARQSKVHAICLFSIEDLLALWWRPRRARSGAPIRRRVAA
jgi:hypothetical protein